MIFWIKIILHIKLNRLKINIEIVVSVQFNDVCHEFVFANCVVTSHVLIVSIIQIYRPWTPRRTSGRIVHKKNWRESEAYRNFDKRFDWSLAIKRHIVMAAPLKVTAPSGLQNSMKSSSRRFDGKSRSLDDRVLCFDCDDENCERCTLPNSHLISMVVDTWYIFGKLTNNWSPFFIFNRNRIPIDQKLFHLKLNKSEETKKLLLPLTFMLVVTLLPLLSAVYVAIVKY